MRPIDPSERGTVSTGVASMPSGSQRATPTRAFPTSLLSPTNNLTAAIASDMGNTASGGEHNLALWTMALLLFIISLICIFLIHMISGKGEAKKA